MHPFLFVTTAFLAGAFLFLCVGAWRVFRGRERPRPFMERAAMAGIFATVGWQALTWLRADQAVASQTASSESGSSCSAPSASPV
jgi:hypothetical protein